MLVKTLPTCRFLQFTILTSFLNSLIVKLYGVNLLKNFKCCSLEILYKNLNRFMKQTTPRPMIASYLTNFFSFLNVK